MTATLTLKREGLGLELRRGQLDVVVDGDSVGSINWHETAELPLEPGHHTLQIRAGRYSSKSAGFDVGDGANASFRCHGAMLWPRYLASLVAPSLGISLKREF